MSQHEKKCSRFFGSHFFVLFMHVWGNVSKNPSHPKNLPAYTPIVLGLVTGKRIVFNSSIAKHSLLRRCWRPV